MSQNSKLFKASKKRLLSFLSETLKELRDFENPLYFKLFNVSESLKLKVIVSSDYEALKSYSYVLKNGYLSLVLGKKASECLCKEKISYSELISIFLHEFGHIYNELTERELVLINLPENERKFKKEVLAWLTAIEFLKELRIEINLSDLKRILRISLYSHSEALKIPESKAEIEIEAICENLVKMSENSELIIEKDSEYEFIRPIRNNSFGITQNSLEKSGFIDLDLKECFNLSDKVLNELFSEGILPINLDLKSSDFENIRKLRSFLDKELFEFEKYNYRALASKEYEIAGFKVSILLYRNYNHGSCVLDRENCPDMRQILIDVSKDGKNPNLTFLHELGHILSWKLVEKVRKMANSDLEPIYILIREIVAWKIAIFLLRALFLEIWETEALNFLDLASYCLNTYVYNRLNSAYKEKTALNFARILIPQFFDGDFYAYCLKLDSFYRRESEALGLIKRDMESE